METASFAAFEAREIQRYWGWALALGVLFVIVGILCLSSTVIATLLTTALLGALAIIGGVGLMVSVFWGDGALSRLLRVVLGLALALAGWSILARPVIAALTLTALMGWYFIFSGALRLIITVVEHARGWGWNFVHGGLTLLLGVLLLARWPLSGLVAIGLFLGIYLLFDGFIWIVGALTARAALLPPHASSASAVV